MWIIEYYETADGECPISQYLDGFDKAKELPYFTREIDLLEEKGYKLVRPHADYLRDDIYELRIRIKHVQYRILYFFYYQDKIILTNGTQKYDLVPRTAIERAIRYKNDYFSRNVRKK